jgi:hypothetical protein
MSGNNVVRIGAADREEQRALAQALKERKIAAKIRAALARGSERDAITKMIAYHFPAAALLYAAAYALPVLDLIEPNNADVASWSLLALAGVVYFRISLTGWIGPLLFVLITAGAVYAMKEGTIAVSDTWLTRARDVLTVMIGTFIASVLFTLFGERSM